MLLFYPAPNGLDLDEVQRCGLSSPADGDLRLYTSLETVKRASTGPILIVDPTVLEAPLHPDGEVVRTGTVPPAALQNLAPYRPPVPVTAGGGYVACPLPDDVALLLIYRRGVWDLPKGKQDPGEALDACALREVREEVGIHRLHLHRSLGTTQHCYPDGDVYAVKTTQWYLMQTPERFFDPERCEGIQRVAWARWTVARRHMGYDTLRRHMDRIEPDVRAALSEK